LVVAAFVEPNRVVPGLLAGEPFHEWRPARYWREILRADGERGQVSPTTAQTIPPLHSGVDVLTYCARDPDPNVRWPAIALLGRPGHYTHEVLPTVRHALRDEHLAVRLQAIVVLDRMGTNAFAAIADLVAVMRDDPELQARFFAERALWFINPDAARTAGGWREVSSAEWGFSADFPTAPEEGDIVRETPWGPAKSRFFNAPHGITRCVVIVTDIPEAAVRETTEAQRLDGMRDTAAQSYPGGRLAREEDIELDGHRGREFLIEVPDFGEVRNRVYWVGRRQFGVMVTYKPKYLIPPAAQHFFDSFRIKPPPKP
jgi:hypothetical protein